MNQRIELRMVDGRLMAFLWQLVGTQDVTDQLPDTLTGIGQPVAGQHTEIESVAIAMVKE